MTSFEKSPANSVCQNQDMNQRRVLSLSFMMNIGQAHIDSQIDIYIPIRRIIVGG